LANKNSAEKFREYFSQVSVASTYLLKLAGTNAIGLDKVDAANFKGKLLEEVSLISNKGLAGTYRFTKYKEKLVSKGAGKPPRQLSIPTIRDRLTLKIVCQFLFDVFPEAKPELPQEKIERLRKAVDAGTHQHFIKIDLKDFYPSINHQLLLTKLNKRVRYPQFRNLITAALENPTVPENNVKASTANRKGVAQGLSISNVLAEIFMLDIDVQIQKIAPVCFRYVDDIIVLASENPELVCQKICSVLKKSKLNPHPLTSSGSKTQVGVIADGLDFLGYSLKPLQVSVRKSSIANFESSLVAVFTDYKHRVRKAKTPMERESALQKFRWALNLKLTGCIYKKQRFGWVFYYSQINDLGVLRRLDNTVCMLFERFKIDIPPNPKRLLKAFYESKRTDKESHWYIPNYDSMTIPKMRAFLESIGYSSAGSFPDDEVEFTFHRLVRSATRQLEKDISSVS
jgi:RNA-directed DNA polymerase